MYPLISLIYSSGSKPANRTKQRFISLFRATFHFLRDLQSHTVELCEKESRDFDYISRARQQTFERPGRDAMRVFNGISQQYLGETVGTFQWNRRSRSLYLGAFLLTTADESFGTSFRAGKIANKTTRRLLKT